MTVSEIELGRLQAVAKHKGFVLERGADGSLSVIRNGDARQVTTARDAYRIMRRTKLTEEEQREIYFRLYGPNS